MERTIKETTEVVPIIFGKEWDRLEAALGYRLSDEQRIQIQYQFSRQAVPLVRQMLMDGEAVLVIRK